jgi:hypothetical protein
MDMSTRKSLLVATMLGVSPAATDGPQAAAEADLVGSWTLVAADVLQTDGSRTRDYGEDPKGLLIIDGQGRYTLQIYNSSRPKFASGDKTRGTPAEYQSAVLGSSVHFGRISVDMEKRTFTLDVERSSFPNQEGTKQKRDFELRGDELSYRVQARPDGTIPISVWRRSI